jgi:hypothetical protein
MNHKDFGWATATSSMPLPVMSVQIEICSYSAKRTRRACQSREEFEHSFFVAGTHTTVDLLWKDVPAHKQRSTCCGRTGRDSVPGTTHVVHIV